MNYSKKKTLIFLCPLLAPERVAKSKYYWNSSLWNDYSTIWIETKLPKSDVMVERHLNELTNFINLFQNTDPIMLGNSIGAWWIANLASRKTNLKAAVMINPIADDYYDPLINATFKYSILSQKPSLQGPTKILVASSDKSSRVAKHFSGVPYLLDFNLFRPKNYHSCLSFIKDWLEVL
jgi:hypothetical protein